MTARHLYILPLLLCMCCICSSCSGVRDAQQTVAMADSLRVNEGITCDDSLALAEAYSTLGHWRLIYPDDYARSCYYYGRMLRNRNDQVAAMQAFIRGTHAPYIQRFIPLPQFTEYHIIGRIYSNMGTMCHSAGEYELAYAMNEESSESFHKVCDTTAYYYALNAMALQLAEQKQHDETLSLLARIEAECTDSNVLTKIWETKAIMYERADMYDSALYAAKELNARGYFTSIGDVIEAQAFWNLQQYDSALYYAQLVMRHQYVSYQDKFNMLYILTYNDSTIDNDEVKKRAEERADIDKEILDPLHEQLTQAVDLLRSDLDKKPHYLNIALLLFSLVLVGCTTWSAAFWIKRRHKRSMDAIVTKHQEIQQDISVQRQALYAETERERQKQSDIHQQCEELAEQSRMIRAEHSAYYEQLRQEIEKNCILLRNMQNLEKELSWRENDALCIIADKNLNLLASKLRALNVLNEREIHLCILVTIGGFTDKQLANLLFYSDNSIRSIKMKTATKLGTTSTHLREILIEKAVCAVEKNS